MQITLQLNDDELKQLIMDFLTPKGYEINLITFDFYGGTHAIVTAEDGR
jgi:hypothetical protein